MNLKSEVMATVMQGRANDIKRLLLSPAQVQLVRSISIGDLTRASQLTAPLGITSALANAKLKRLSDLGYVQRKKVPMDSGGMEYFYFT